MDKENNEISEVKKQKPQVFFKSITFNDDTSIELSHNSIVVFTGANNSGKSQVLKDAENYFNPSCPISIIIKKADCEYCGEIDEPIFLNERFQKDQNGLFHALELGSKFEKDALQSFWNLHTFYNGFYKIFIKRLGTEFRLTASNAIKRNDDAQQHPIYKLFNCEELAQTISGYFYQAFGVELLVNRNDFQTVPLHIGKAPDKKAYTMERQDYYYNEVKKLPKLHDQGDGMRSFASILLDTFTSVHSITLIDEPEAFLHPPQARVLGKMLAKNNPNDRQLFISTHSEDFLQGLLDADNENVTVIRINRVNDINKMSVLQNDKIEKLWSNPILRYSNILSGLFHEKVVVCESDYDCLFYQAVINAVFGHKNEIAPDVLFTHCGGKHRIKDIVAALKAVNVPVVAICDFDLLNSKPDFKAIIEAYGLDWNMSLETDMKTIYDGMNAKTDAWKNIKKIGKAGFTGDEPSAYEKVEALCKSVGLFIVPFGEIECFDKTINKEKKDWVYHVLENYDLATEPRMDNARKFVQEVLDYRIMDNT